MGRKLCKPGVSGYRRGFGWCVDGKEFVRLVLKMRHSKRSRRSHQKGGR